MRGRKSRRAVERSMHGFVQEVMMHNSFEKWRQKHQMMDTGRLFMPGVGLFVGGDGRSWVLSSNPAQLLN